ncbi:MAG TPA: glycosyltransferase family A protein [Candidatus Eisenbacteria bacterium]|nr:glycosyltransferase family A protein [Candidatus Eisenbacteria bacterium]
MSSRPRVTVGMPVHNARPYVAAAIESVLAQDHPSFELVIVDDGSTDGTAGVLQRYRDRPGVRIVSNKKRLGRGRSRNLITRLSRGIYLSPCDADDVMLPGNLKTLGRYLDRHPDVGAVYADVRMETVDRRGRVLKQNGIRGRDCNRTWDLFDYAVNHPGCMMRKSCLVRVGGYDEKVAYVDDWSLFLKLAEITRIRYLPGRAYYVWRQHPGNVRKCTRRDLMDLARLRHEAFVRRYGAGT